MVRKITSGEYLKRFDNMTAVERSEYLGRVGDWLSVSGQDLVKKGEVFEARMQNVLQVSVSWNDAECVAFEEGAVLLSALAATNDTWLPDMLYVKSAKRAIKQMFQQLWSVDEGAATDVSDGKAARHTTYSVDAGGAVSVNAGMQSGERMQAGAAKEAPFKPAAPFQGNAGDGHIAGGNQDGKAQVDLVPARPKSIHQYVHLLPKKTQEHAALVQGLYRELDDARQKLELLTNDPTASAADREAWAKKVTKCDNTLRKIFDELDAEWAKLVKRGGVVVDDLGIARVVSEEHKSEELRVKSEESAGAVSDGPVSGGSTAESTPADDGTSALTSEQRARRRDLRKWLTDTRRGNGSAREERVKQWYVNFREYLALEGDAAFEDAKIKEAIGHYGIDVEKLKG